MIQYMQKAVVGSAHGKLILVGEHAVVYGKPAIALPFPLLKATASTVEEPSAKIIISSDYYMGPLDQVPKKMQGIAACIHETLKSVNNSQKNLLIRLDSTIPLGRGLGASAAIAIAIVKSLFAFHGQKVQPDQLMSLVHQAETFAHGNPSGIDMAASLSEYPIWFQKGKSLEPLQIGGPLYLVVADTGRFGDTHGAVESVRNKFIGKPEKTERNLNQLEAITLDARSALAAGDMKLLGRLVDLAQQELVDLGVSDEGLNTLVTTARKAGALGAKLTGGGRGGCILAIADSLANAKIIAAELMKAGACKSWYFRFSNQG